MIIEHPETLRTWLTNTLSPICDADPAALAKYVMALLKKDKSEQELKDFCVEQLDVFLQKETKGFVEQLFIVIRDKSYLNVGAVKQEPIGGTSQNVPAETVVKEPDVAGSVGTAIILPPPTSNQSRHRSRDNQRPGTKRPLSRSPPSNKSGSRSRSRDRNRGNDKNMPLPGTGRVHGAGSSGVSSTMRDRDKENRDLRYSRQHSPRDRKSATSRDRSNRQRSRELSPNVDISNVGTATRIPVESFGSESGDNKNVDKGKKRKKQRCRDYDEKGYCMRGDSCLYDHGPDPVVVEEVSLPRMITMKAPPPPVDFSQPPPGYSAHPPPPGVDHSFAAATEAYNPEAPSISSTVVPASVQAMSYGQPTPAVWGQPLPIYPPSAPYNPIVSKAGFRTRELITLAEGDQVRLASFEHRTEKTAVTVGTGGGGHIMSSRIQQAPPQPYDKTNRTLEVRRIPSHLNTITKLNEHFSQFGQIVNIQVRYQGDAEAALVTFANRHQAVAAYKSTAPILNNRFIRMFWHNKDNAAGEAGGERGSIRDRLGPAPVDPMTPIDDSSMKARHVDTVEDADGNYREVHKKQIQLQKAKMDLFNKQIEHQKLLLRQLEKCKDPNQRKEIAKTIKTVQINVNKLRDELNEIKVQPTAPTSSSRPTKPTKEQIERQLLDAELEMINQRQSGSDTTDLHKRLMELRREVMLLNEMNIGGANSTSTPVHQQAAPVQPPNLNNKSSMIRHVARKTRPIPSYANLDKRPRELLVTGFNANEKDSLIEHFQQFGVLEDLEYLHQNKDQPFRALVVFKLRKEAEMAMSKGKELNNRMLDIQWFNRRSHIPSDKEDSKAELTAQDLLATLDDEDDISSDDNQAGEIDEDIPEIERGWKR